jgi:hypothetical protein
MPLLIVVPVILRLCAAGFSVWVIYTLVMAVVQFLATH